MLSYHELLRHQFCHGQFPLSMLTLNAASMKSMPGTLLMVLAAGKSGVVVKPVGVCHSAGVGNGDVVAVRRCTQLRSAGWGGGVVRCTVPCHEGTTSSDPIGRESVAGPGHCGRLLSESNPRSGGPSAELVVELVIHPGNFFAVRGDRCWPMRNSGSHRQSLGVSMYPAFR